MFFLTPFFLFLKIVYKKWEQNQREFGDDIGFKTDQIKKIQNAERWKTRFL